MLEMTSLERTMAVLDHRIPDRVPVGLHNFLMACRMIGADFVDGLRSGETIAEAQLAAWREFGHDVIMHENGVCAEAEAMGCGILYQKDRPPHVQEPLIHSLDEVEKLEVPDPETTSPLNELLKATRLLVRETKGEVFIIGRADQGPMALASALCGPERFLLACSDETQRPKVLRLVEICSRMNIAFGQAQRRAGAHASSIGAYGSSLISPAMFDALEFPGDKAFCDAMRKIQCKSFVHSCGDETALLENLIRTGADCLELDPGTDPATCKSAVDGKTTVLGMLDPSRVLWQGTSDEVRQHTLDIMRVMAPGGGFIMGPGCALPADTPRNSIHIVMECARTAGVYHPDGSLPWFAQRAHDSMPPL
ncbi:MAG TPA: uroporphyrinogen decarboxylase family protein [Terriglobia bacterium]|jgi:MtaA/CmuA family methyltransferase|nr:uroporphyrinogen decarboxylase family protein [Terriglobia bacterium]